MADKKWFTRGWPKEDKNKEIHVIVCDDCGRKTTVPFKPKIGWPKRCLACSIKAKKDRKRHSPHVGYDLGSHWLDDDDLSSVFSE